MPAAASSAPATSTTSPSTAPPLSAATIAGHYDLGAPNTAPSAALTTTPNPAPTGATVNFNAAASKDPDGTIAKYEWDLDGNGSYETDSGANATTSLSYASAGRAHDRPAGHRQPRRHRDRGATLTVQNQAPTASFTATPNPAPTGSSIALDASGSSDPDGTIAKYEWDLDGNGSYETSTGDDGSRHHLLRQPGQPARSACG